MTNDHELEMWRQEWRSQTEPLPESVLKIKDSIRRQNLRMFLGAILSGALLLLVALWALQNPTWYRVHYAEGFWLLMLLSLIYRFWTLRGTWKPAAQTTRAYLELNYKRAAAVARYLRFLLGILIVTTVISTPFVAWSTWRWIHCCCCRNTRLLVLWPMLVAELLFFLWFHRRKSKKAQEAKRLLDEMGA
jgi:hypothetical protein